MIFNQIFQLFVIIELQKLIIFLVAFSMGEAEKKTLYEAYTDYIDPAEITLHHYLRRPFYPGQQQYFEHIRQWIDDDRNQNRPLVFKTTPGVGVKTILAHWFQQSHQDNEKRKEKILPIIHFASSGSNNSNYFYCLYRIIIKLREAMKIKQGVDLLEQKIRKYFAYWLDICNTELERQQIVCSSEQIYSKIVIAIEGVDKFIDPETGKEANIAFWLPEFFPKNIKLICTVHDPSESLDYFEKKSCRIIPILTSNLVAEKLLGEALNKKTIFGEQQEKRLKDQLQAIYYEAKGQSDIYKIIAIYSGFFLVGRNICKNREAVETIRRTVERNLLGEKNQKIITIEQIYDKILSMYADVPAFKGKLLEYLMYFSLTQKGITVKEFSQLSKFSEEDWALFQSIFGPVLIRHEKIYSIKCFVFRERVIEKETQGERENKLVKYHEQLAGALENTFNSIRKLEEQTYHLFVSKSYFRLKEIVSSIQNFLLMFNANNKYELSRYWQKLEEKGFDPVIEYNKAIESFSMHYHPSDENIFRIIVQISRFLKEFSDFETYETPTFRHPFIQGNMVQLQKIGLLDELTHLDIYVDNSFNSSEEPQFLPVATLDHQIKQVREKYFPKQNEEQTEVKKVVTGGQMVEEVQMIASGRKINKKTNDQILTEVEQLNVDVPMNRDKFRNFYLSTLQEFMKSEDFDQTQNDPGFFVVEDDSEALNQNNSLRPELSFNKIRENYRMRPIKPTLYYYKRWIWIQFPWVCISLHNNYSQTPEFSKNMQCEIDTYEEEAKYTKQALIVAIQAKEKKKMMFTRKANDFNSSYGSRTRQLAITPNKFASSRFGEKSSMRSRVLQKTFSNVDLNLGALTKELEMRKKDMPVSFSKQNIGFFLSEVNENCQEDMKFISQRKQFLVPGIEGVPANEILPKLKWSIKDHTNYEIAYIKSNIEGKKKKLNKIIYENKKLAETYKQLKLKQNLTKKSMTDQESDKQSRRSKQLEELTKKKQEVINQFCKSLLQKQRLKIILKLCAENKTRNEEYLASLNYFLQNLKKMISWQRNHIKEITTELTGKRLMKQRKQAMEVQKCRNEKIVEREAKNYLQEKQKLEQQIENISVIIAEDLRDQKDKLENNLTGHLKNCQQKSMMLMQEKKTKQLEQKLKSLEEQYLELKKLFHLKDQDFENSARFRHLIEENQKNKKLKIIYFQRKTRLEQIQRQYQNLQDQTEKKMGKKKNQEIDEKKERVKVNCKIEESKIKLYNKLNIILSNFCMKLGTSSPADIVPILTKKLESIKEKDPVKYDLLTNQKIEVS